VGLGTFKIARPYQGITGIKHELNRSLEEYKSDQLIFVSGNLIPQINYSLKIRRIWDNQFYKRKDVGLIIIAKKISSYPLLPDEVSKLIDNLRLSHVLSSETVDYIIFKPKA
jgi:hypothetical protein